MKRSGFNVKVIGIASAAALLATGLSACSIIKPPKRPEIETFMLEPPSPEQDEGSTPSSSSMEPSEKRVFRVSTMASSGVYDTPRMAYTRSADEIEYFATHRWADPPPEMLVPILIAGLERTNRFLALVGPSSRAAGDLVLETELLAFRQEFIESKPRFRATIRASIMDTIAGAILGSPRTFDVLEPMDDANPTAGVRAAGRVAERIADEIARYCIETTRESAELSPLAK